MEPVRLARNSSPRVQCYYLGWLGNQDAKIQKKKALLAKAERRNDVIVECQIQDELEAILASVGTIELCDMHIIDYDEAFAAHPDDWVLVEDYKPPTGPTAPKIIDKRNYPEFPTPQQLKSSGPPVLDASLTMNQVKRKIRAGAAGAP